MGQSNLTWQIDAYSFGIYCIEILMKGGIPWPLNDGDTIRHFVLGTPVPRCRTLDLTVRTYRQQRSTRVAVRDAVARCARVGVLIARLGRAPAVYGDRGAPQADAREE
jgi:hypothetical protein